MMNTNDLTINLQSNLGDRIDFIGVFCSDQLEGLDLKSRKPIAFIANTLTSDADVTLMGHWVSFYITHDKVVFFDSYGLDPRIYCRGFRKFVEKIDLKWYAFKIQFQPLKSIKCGLYVLMFIHHISLHNLKGTVVFISKAFSKLNKKKNDDLVTKYFFDNINTRDCRMWKEMTKKAITYNECISDIRRRKIR